MVAMFVFDIPCSSPVVAVGILGSCSATRSAIPAGVIRGAGDSGESGSGSGSLISSTEGILSGICTRGTRVPEVEGSAGGSGNTSRTSTKFGCSSK